MTIAIVANTSWNIYNFRTGILNSLMKQGHTIIVIAPKDEYSEKLIGFGYIYYNIALDNKGNNPLRDLKFLITLWDIYKKVRPDIILHYTIKPNVYGNLAARILGIPSINTISGLGTVFLRTGFTSSLAKYLYKFAFRSSAKVFFQNESDRDLFIKDNLVTPVKTSVVPGSGIDLTKYPRSQTTQKTEVTFLFVGRLLFHKGIMEYLEAAKLLRNKNYNWIFQICGAVEPEANLGIQEVRLREWVEKNYVEYLGFSNQIEKVINESSCVVLPSYREGISRTLLESAALSKPLIASDVPGCREIVINNLNGYTCLPANANDLADKMEKMGLLSIEQREKLGANGRNFVEQNFDEKIVINKYVDAIETIKNRNNNYVI